MPDLDTHQLLAYRARTYHTAPGSRLLSAEDAVQFVNERGFVFFWPIKGVEMPSLWAAVAGDRPVADEHDDPGHVTWGWKDELLGKKRWYYARLLRRRNTVISLTTAPYFYALSPNYGDPENDYLEEYLSGSLSLEEKLVYEALLNNGPLDTLALRREARLSGESSTARFNRALDNLQIAMKILPIGISDAGAWHYAFIYDIVARHMPEIQDKAREISEHAARRHLIMLYLRSVGGAPQARVGQLFGWRKEDLQRAITKLVNDGALVADVTVEGQNAPWLTIPELIS